MNETKEQLNHILKELTVNKKWVDLTPATLLNNLDLDSLDMLDLQMQIEKTLGVEVALKNLDSFATIDDLYSKIVSLQQKND
jgi:acyl carrier protein